MMIAPAIIRVNLNLLLMDMAASSSALKIYRAVILFDFLFSQISSNPVAIKETYASKKGSSVSKSSRSSLVAERPLS